MEIDLRLSDKPPLGGSWSTFFKLIGSILRTSQDAKKSDFGPEIVWKNDDTAELYFYHGEKTEKKPRLTFHFFPGSREDMEKILKSYSDMLIPTEDEITWFIVNHVAEFMAKSKEPHRPQRNQPLVFKRPRLQLVPSDHPAPPRSSAPSRKQSSLTGTKRTTSEVSKKRVEPIVVKRRRVQRASPPQPPQQEPAVLSPPLPEQLPFSSQELSLLLPPVEPVSLFGEQGYHPPLEGSILVENPPQEASPLQMEEEVRYDEEDLPDDDLSEGDEESEMQTEVTYPEPRPAPEYVVLRQSFLDVRTLSWLCEEIFKMLSEILDRETMQIFLEKLEYGNENNTPEERYERFLNDLFEVARAVLRRQDQNGEDVEPTPEQLIEFFRPVVWALFSTFSDGSIGDIPTSFRTLRETVGYNPGSGFFTFWYIWWMYFLWRRSGIQQRDEIIHLKMKWRRPPTRDDEQDFEEENGRVYRFFESDVQIDRQFMRLGRLALLETLRNMFSRIHFDIEKSWGVDGEYWYHGGGNDPLTENFVDVFTRIQGNLTLRNTGEDTEIMENNRFWELYFGNEGSIWYSDKLAHTLDEFRDKHVTMIPDEWNHNCLRKALECTCPLHTVKCCCGGGEGLGAIVMGDLKEMLAESNVLVISINVYPRASRKLKDVELVVLGTKYFTDEHPRVIMINNPVYHGGKAHCCLFRPEPSENEEEESKWERFERLGFYNSFLHVVTKSKRDICPICGIVYLEKDKKVHFKTHREGFICEFCGIKFDTEEEKKIHGEYHCRHLGLGCSYEFADEIKMYTEKESKERTIIYADLESAIEEDGRHQTILCGWADEKTYDVHISGRISDMLNYATHLSGDVIIYFHNGEGYDFHFVLLELGKIGYEMMKEMNVTADSSEKIRYFDIKYKSRGSEEFKHIYFRDTFAFVSQSLSNWLESTKRSNPDFSCFKKNFPNEEEQQLVLQKNPFPYNAIKCADDLDKDISLMEEWFNAENNTELFCDKFTKDELKQIFDTWFTPAKAVFKWRTIKDYYETYLKCDVAQLCDVMEHFAKNVMEEFELDVHSYYGTPSLTWAAWLKHIEGKFRLDPIPEESFDIVNSSIRGGQTGAMRRYYDYMDFDSGKMCFDLDCNSLYATVMLKMKYPCHDWKIEKNLPSDPHELLIWIKELHESGKSGFIEATFDVKDDPELYSYMPVASRRKLSGIYHYETMEKYTEESGESTDAMVFHGLCNVVGRHEHYCCHTKLLAFYLEMGFITMHEVHRCVYGVDEPIFEEYVSHNLQKRAEFSADPIKKMLYKLMNNSLYGKTYEDVTKRMDMQAVQTVKYDLIDPATKKREILKLEKWVLYEATQRSFLMEKPVYLGAAITEFSKYWMYRFFYCQIRPIYPTAEVLYTDTDAITVCFPREVKSFQEIAHALQLRYGEQIIDTSNWADPKIMGEGTYEMNNQPGLFKSETDDSPIVRMIALRAKTYIMICENGKVKMSVKGCPMKEKSKLTFHDFEEVLFGNGKKKVIEYDAITSKYHIVKSTKLTRVVLSADDLKRYIHDDRIHTSPLFSAPHLSSH